MFDMIGKGDLFLRSCASATFLSLVIQHRGRTLLKKCLRSGYSPNQHAHAALLSRCVFRVCKDILKSRQKVHHDCPLTLVRVFQKQCLYLILCSEMLSFSF